MKFPHGYDLYNPLFVVFTLSEHFVLPGPHPAIHQWDFIIKRGKKVLLIVNYQNRLAIHVKVKTETEN